MFHLHYIKNWILFTVLKDFDNLHINKHFQRDHVLKKWRTFLIFYRIAVYTLFCIWQPLLSINFIATPGTKNIFSANKIRRSIKENSKILHKKYKICEKKSFYFKLNLFHTKFNFIQTKLNFLPTKLYVLQTHSIFYISNSTFLQIKSNFVIFI